MLRICFIGGYAIFLILVIALMAIKVISVLGPGGLGDVAKELADLLFTPERMTFWGIVISGGFVAWLIALLKIAKNAPTWERKWVKTLIIGCIFMSGFFLVLGIVGASVFLLEGFPGEVAAKIAGYMSSPVFMELSFFMIGLTLLFSFNIVRRLFEGEEFVEIEIPKHVLEDLEKDKES
ncbi:hypothetical protein ACFPK9_01855 [Rubritalea spongiae]|uniref:DUF2975 domain-containing protein n=1 Tax=Rubritalea spongiae TaxID=430797 RepID=A0ABW5E477_9BACT